MHLTFNREARSECMESIGISLWLRNSFYSLLYPMVYRYTHNTHDTLTDQTDSPKICERVSERTTPKTERNDKKREVMNQTKRS